MGGSFLPPLSPELTQERFFSPQVEIRNVSNDKLKTFKKKLKNKNMNNSMSNDNMT